MPVGACWCLLVPVGACWWPVGACWCLLVPVGACWCLLVGACWLVPVGACWWCLLACVCGGCVQDFWASPRPSSAGPPFPWTAQNFALFFSLSHRISFFLLSLEVFSLNFGGVLKAGALKCARLEFSGCRVKPRRPRSRRGFTRRAHLRVDRLEGVQEIGGCIRELHDMTVELDRQGFVGRPAWVELELGARPPPANVIEPGEWAHGWQYFASSVSEHHFRESIVLRQSCPSHQAHLRSHSVGGSSNVLHGCPTRPEFTVEPELFRTLILERLRLPLAVQTLFASVAPSSTPEDATGPLVHIQVGYAREQWHLRGHWQGFAEKLEPLSVPTSNCGT